MARILLVDDDQTVLDLEKLYLTEAGHEVLIATSAKLATTTLSVHDVDLIILDVMMPEVNGFQFLNAIKNSPRLRHLSIAFLTSRKEQNDVMRAAKLGADFYLLKPIEKADYIGKISNFFEKKAPKQRAHLNLQNLFAGEAKISYSMTLVSISDLGIDMVISQALTVGQTIELSAPIFNEIPLRNPKFRVSSVAPNPTGGFDVHLQFADSNSEATKRVQEWITNKNSRNQNLKSS